MPANRALPLNTNQIGNIRPDIPPSQNNCAEQTERSTMHFFHEEGRGGEGKGGGSEIQTYCSQSQRRTKLVELERLQNWENSAVQQADSARGLAVHRWRVECACAAACIVTYRKQLSPPPTPPLIHTVNHCTATRWTITLLGWTCDITMSDQWPTALAACTRGSKCKQRKLSPPLFFFSPFSSHAQWR